MRVPEDLHPDDLHSRLALADALREHRDDAGLSTAALGAGLNVTSMAVRALERRSSWEARTIMRYSRAIGWRTEWFLDNLVVPDDGDVMSLIYAAVPAGDGDQQDRAHWRAVCNDLRRIRRAQHSAVDFARILRVQENAVHYWEANPDGSSVISGQRHARGLGGRLGWRLHKLGADRVVPGQRPAAA